MTCLSVTGLLFGIALTFIGAMPPFDPVLVGLGITLVLLSQIADDVREIKNRKVSHE